MKVFMIEVVFLLTVVLSLNYGSPVESISREKRSDDPSPLQAVVQQQGMLLQELQAKVTALESKSIAVAFSVRFNSDPTAGIPLVSGMTLKFDHIISNIANGYDPQTGVFTTPVAGIYTFFLTTMSVNHRQHLQLTINNHGVALDRIFAEGNQDNYDQGSTEISVHLNSGQQVWVSQNLGDAVRGGYWTVFTGFLVQAD